VRILLRKLAGLQMIACHSPIFICTLTNSLLASFGTVIKVTVFDIHVGDVIVMLFRL
jgi:hypothetical protein